MTRITLVGCGLVGGSWAVVFSRAGFEVTLYDPSPASVDAAMAVARTSAVTLAGQNLLDNQTPEQVLARLKPVGSLADAVAGADYI